MQTRTVLLACRLLAALACPAVVRADESVADWLKKILDPATIGVAPFPGATLNRKLTVDTIRYDRDAPAAKRTAVYVLPLAQIDDAVHHFTQQLGMQPLGDTDAHGAKRYLFVVTGADHQPAMAKGLRVSLMRSPWVDGMAQIEMVYLPPS